ncbi:MAG: hypothetical protein NC324_01895 [Bacteroides sp.]|nr:hypothetical protein [Bacteroides sp.]
MKGIRWFVLLSLCVGSVCLTRAQNYVEHLNDARKYFRAGDYERAEKSLGVYRSMTGKTDKDLEQKVSKCIDYLKKAELERNRYNYDDALAWYLLVHMINPNDKRVEREMESMRSGVTLGESSERGKNSYPGFRVACSI